MQHSDLALLMSRIDVVAGILRKPDGCVLIAERLADQAMRGLWEFPGGKVADGETSANALRRELREELGIDIIRFEHFTSLEHDYDDRQVALDFYLVSEWNGEPRSCEGQQLRWQNPGSIKDGMMLAADAPVLTQLVNFSG